MSSAEAFMAAAPPRKARVVEKALTRADEENIELLAQAVRLAAKFGWTEGVRSHFSVALSGNRIAVQNEDIPWSLMTAKDICVFDLDAPERPKGVSVSAFYTHRDLHRAHGNRARCVLHLHSPAATALSCTTPGKLEMVHQNCAYFYRAVGYFDYPETGTETTNEVNNAVARCFGKTNRVLLQANHGVLVIGESIYSAFDDLFYFENACSIYCRALSTAQPLKILDPEVCERIMAMRDRDREEYGKRNMRAFVTEMISKL